MLPALISTPADINNFEALRGGDLIAAHLLAQMTSALPIDEETAEARYGPGLAWMPLSVAS